MQEPANTLTALGDVRLPVSRVGVGTWAIGGGWGPQPETVSLQALLCALERGCQLIDTAALYGNGRAERLVAQAFRDHGRRVTTLTKVFPRDYQWAPAPGTPISAVFPPEHIIRQAEQSLTRLQTDCLDGLLLQTWCPTWSEETEWYQTLLKLREQGKIRAFGISVSDHRPGEANGVILAGRVDMIEVSYSILDQRATERLFPLAQGRNVSVIARSPLASGALAGFWHEEMRFRRGDWRRRVFCGELLRQTVQRVARLRTAVGVGPGEALAPIALRFCLSHPAVTAVIPGVRTAEQALCNLASAEQGPLPQEMLDQIARLWQDEFSQHVRTSIGAEGEGEARNRSRTSSLENDAH